MNFALDGTSFGELAGLSSMEAIRTLANTLALRRNKERERERERERVREKEIVP